MLPRSACSGETNMRNQWSGWLTPITLAVALHLCAGHAGRRPARSVCDAIAGIGPHAHATVWPVRGLSGGARTVSPVRAGQGEGVQPAPDRRRQAGPPGPLGPDRHSQHGEHRRTSRDDGWFGRNNGCHRSGGRKFDLSWAAAQRDTHFSTYLNPAQLCAPAVAEAGVPGPGGFRIVQHPGSVVMINDYAHTYRVIYTDGRPHIGPAMQLHEGDSRGRWEGNTLVVDVTNQRAGPGSITSGTSSATPCTSSSASR